MTEADLARRIVIWLNRQPYTVARKRHGTQYGVAGDPDIYGCVAGQHFEMEVKRPGEKTTALQAHRLLDWHNVGAVTGVVHSLQEAQELYHVARQRAEARRVHREMPQL